MPAGLPYLQKRTCSTGTRDVGSVHTLQHYQGLPASIKQPARGARRMLEANRRTLTSFASRSGYLCTMTLMLRNATYLANETEGLSNIRVDHEAMQKQWWSRSRSRGRNWSLTRECLCRSFLLCCAFCSTHWISGSEASSVTRLGVILRSSALSGTSPMVSSCWKMT